MLDVHNPATGEVIARIPNSTAADIDRAMRSARDAFEGRAWGGMDMRARAELVNRLADAFEANLDAAVPAGDAQQRPPGQRDPRAALAAPGFLPLLRRAGAGAPRCGHPRRRLLSELYAAHADRRRCELHAVQSSADDPVQIAGGRARQRLRHRGQAIGIYPADDPEAGADLYRSGIAARRVQYRARALARAPARCWPSIPISTSWC